LELNIGLVEQLGNHYFFSKSKINHFRAPPLNSVVILLLAFHGDESFNPLSEFEIVRVSGFGQLVNLNKK
jgi:hypothetical protein